MLDASIGIKALATLLCPSFPNPNITLCPKTYPTKNPHILIKMLSSLTPKQVAKQAVRERAEMETRVKYLQTQLGQLLEEKRGRIEAPTGPITVLFLMSPRGRKTASMGVQVKKAPLEDPKEGVRATLETSKLIGQLDSDHLLDWLQTVERVFEYKDISNDKKVKLVAIKLRKYGSIWWANLVAKRARKGKGKIRTSTKMRDKLKPNSLPSHYLQDNYLILHHLKQETKSVEEYTREFEQLLLKCDLREDDAHNFTEVFKWFG